MKKALPALMLMACIFCATSSFAQVFANFSYIGGSCQNTTSTQFQDYSTTTTGTITTWTWNFGDVASGTNTSVEQNPVHVFTASGQYMTTLIAGNSLGQKDTVTYTVDIKLIPVIIYPPFSPVCQFTPVLATTATVTNGVSGSGVYYGNVDTNGYYDAATAGIHTFNYIFTSAQGCIASEVQTVIVNPKPEAMFTVNALHQCFGSNNFVFANGSTIQSGTMNFAWIFGDGNTSAASNPSHTYSSAGTYQVTLIATSNNGCLDTATQIVTVGYTTYSTTIISVCPPQLPYTWNGNNYNTTGTYTFTLVNTMGCDSIAKLYLTVKTSSSSTANVSVCANNLPYSWGGQLYYTSGNYKDTLVNAAGCDSTVTLHLTVKPVTTSTHDTAVCQSSLPFMWNGLNISTPGHYTKTLTGSMGCDSIAQLTLIILPAPNAMFSYGPHDSACYRNEIVFYPTANVTYHWDFGDGTTSTLMNPIHQYQNPGTYTVKLVAGGSCGYDSMISTITIIPENKTIVPASPLTLFANRQCNADSGWTNYYYDNNTPNITGDDTLLLSLKLNGNYIGDVGNGTFQLKMVATPGAGSNTGILLTNPLITNPTGYYVMNRYWNVQPSAQPTTPVGVRFYFNTQDLTDVNGSYPLHNLTFNDLIFYKTTGGNPDPTTNLAGASAIATITNAAVADTAHWVYSSLSANSHVAEFEVSHFSGGGGGATGNGQVLPQRITSFDAARKGGSNLLTWITCAQVKGFEIQRSQSTANFSAVGYVPAETGVCRQHNFTDNEPLPGTNYYRLKMMDNDGKFSYSAIRTVNNNGHVALAAYPNPAKDVLSVRIASETKKDIQLEILNAEGKMLQLIKTTAEQGVETKMLNIALLKTGIYFVKLTSENEMQMVKFTKL